jgi:hypothetical protein
MTTEGPGPSEFGVSDFGISSGDVRDHRPHEPTGTGGGDARFELAASVRRITAAMVGLPLSEDDISGAAAAVAGIADRLERAAAPGRRPRAQPDPVGEPQDFFPTSPVIGFANPVAPPVVVEAAGGELRGSAYFDYQYEGPPTCVHGGVLAMVFDEMLGAANILAGSADRPLCVPRYVSRRASPVVTGARSVPPGPSTTVTSSRPRPRGSSSSSFRSGS